MLEEISNSELEFFSFFLQNKYFTKKSDFALLIFPQKTEAVLYFKKNIFENLKARKAKLTQFIEMLFLIEYLKQDRLISILPFQQPNLTMHALHEDFEPINLPIKDQKIFLNQEGLYLKTTDPGKICNSDNSIKFEGVVLEKNIYDLIINNFFGLLFVSEELKSYVKNHFKSIDDIRYKNSQIATWVSIIMAFLFGSFGMYSSIKTTQKSDIINKHQFSETIKYQKELKQEVSRILYLLKNKNQSGNKNDKTKFK